MCSILEPTPIAAKSMMAETTVGVYRQSQLLLSRYGHPNGQSPIQLSKLDCTEAVSRHYASWVPQPTRLSRRKALLWCTTPIKGFRARYRSSSWPSALRNSERSSYRSLWHYGGCRRRVLRGSSSAKPTAVMGLKGNVIDQCEPESLCVDGIWKLY